MSDASTGPDRRAAIAKRLLAELGQELPDARPFALPDGVQDLHAFGVDGPDGAVVLVLKPGRHAQLVRDLTELLFGDFADPTLRVFEGAVQDFKEEEIAYQCRPHHDR